MSERPIQPEGILIETDPQQKRFQKNINKWVVGETTYEEVMKSYPRYTIEENLRFALEKLLPNVF